MEVFLNALHVEVKEQGAKGLYARTGFKSEANLLQYVNANAETHNLSLPKFLLILQNLEQERAYRVLNALAGEFGYELEAKEKVAPKGLVSSLLSVSREVAELTVSVGDALDDNHVNQLEKAAIRRGIDDVRGSLDVLEQSVRIA